MKLAGFISLLVLGNLLFFPIIAIPSENASVNWHSYSEEVLSFAEETDRPIFMVIKAEWCHVCMLYEETVLNTEEIAGFLNENYVPILIDFDQDQDIARNYAFATPTTVIFSPESEMAVSIPGFIEKERLLLGLKSSLVPLKNGHLDKASENFQINNNERLSFGNSTIKTAVPISRDDIPRERNIKPVLGVLLFIFLSTIITRYRVFKRD